MRHIYDGSPVCGLVCNASNLSRRSSIWLSRFSTLNSNAFNCSDINLWSLISRSLIKSSPLCNEFFWFASGTCESFVFCSSWSVVSLAEATTLWLCGIAVVWWVIELESVGSDVPAKDNSIGNIDATVDDWKLSGIWTGWLELLGVDTTDANTLIFIISSFCFCWSESIYWYYMIWAIRLESWIFIDE